MNDTAFLYASSMFASDAASYFIASNSHNGHIDMFFFRT